ncbi:MAG: SCO family protein [Alicycliphilus sp.]|jgi:protein SCO1/2|nr:SCO family protein [Alicycliphilus sp.]MBP7325111.1 SCO family protein [Alicycliphilus sp.]MBP7328454.1 SCO family protein [Alicycliphilus sp.]MBP8779170.1 SCO family protein [Alicycliphilus sp.]TXJ09166.1 MAG: SCO family protein [Alicycliphilus sp.]
MACLSLLRIRHALATCAAGLMLALPAMASSSNTTDLGLDREAALRTSQAAIGRKVGDHILLNREGVPTSLASYRGKPLLVSFIYTGCFQVCPTTTRSLQEAVEGLLKSVGPNQFNVVSIGFNQPADSPQALKSFATQYGIRQPNWEFLSPPAALVPDLARDFGFVFQASPAGFDHVLQVSILDGEGRIVRQVYGEGVVPSELGEPLKMLLAGQPVESNELIEHLVDRVRILCTVFDPKTGTYKVDYTLPIQIAGGVTFFVLMLIFFINEWRSSRKMARSKGMRNA